MNLSKISLAVSTALNTPGAFVTERGVEIEQPNGYQEILVSFSGLKGLIEAEEAAAVDLDKKPEGEDKQPEKEVVDTQPPAEDSVVAPPEGDANKPEGEEIKAPESTTVTEPEKAPEPVVKAPEADKPKAKPGPKPKAPAAA